MKKLVTLIALACLTTLARADTNNTYTLTVVTNTTVIAVATNLTYAYVAVVVSNAPYYYEADSDSTNALTSANAVFPAGSSWNYGSYANAKIPSYIKVCPVSGTAVVSVVRTPR